MSEVTLKLDSEVLLAGIIGRDKDDGPSLDGNYIDYVFAKHEGELAIILLIKPKIEYAEGSK